MSRISFDSYINGKDVEIVAGWDNPMNTYWIDIVNKEDDEDLIYSSMTNFDWYFSLDSIKQVLKDYQVTPPYNFWNMVEQKSGNVIHHFKRN